MSAAETFFAPCAPGFEKILLEEVRAIRLGRPEAQPGGVQFSGTIRDAWTANLRLRAASRVLLTLSRFEAADADALYRGIRRVDWERFLGPDGSFVVQARTKASGLSHDHFVEQRAKDAVADAFREKHGRRPNVSLTDPDLRIHVRVNRDRAIVSADTTGESLFKRGWRRYSGAASLKENLAAALVLASGWDRRAPFLDPFCGSGTLLVEAAMIAANAAPGLYREAFDFRRWPGHDEDAWQAQRAAARVERAFPAKLRILGRDSDPDAVGGAKANLAAAGFGDEVAVDRGGFEGIETKAGWNAFLVTNPPYGERVGTERKLIPVYERFGAMLRERCGGYRAAVLGGNRELMEKIGIRPALAIGTKNGPIDCELRIYDIPR